MQGIADRARHVRVTCQRRNHPIGCDTAFGDFFDRLVDALGGTIRNQIVAFGNHAFDILRGNGAVQNNRIPVHFVLMIARNHGRIGVPPEITPFGRYLYIQIEISPSVVNPEKGLFASLDAHQLPVLVAKGSFCVYIRKG